MAKQPSKQLTSEWHNWPRGRFANGCAVAPLGLGSHPGTQLDGRSTDAVQPRGKQEEVGTPP